jgi:hypothetical protein
LRPAQANSSQDPISKITKPKCTRGVAQEIECLLCNHEVLGSNPNLIPTQKFTTWTLTEKFAKLRHVLSPGQSALLFIL